jgi:hypothetical protein
MHKQIRDIAKQRAEQVWDQGSPLNKEYKSLCCETCSMDTQEAVCLPIGYSWRSGWVFLCEECYYAANYWQEDEDALKKDYDRYCVKVS